MKLWKFRMMNKAIKCILQFKILLGMTISFKIKMIKIKIFNRPYVLTRTACLGNDIQNSVIKSNVIRINYQKSRVDHLNSQLNKSVPLIKVWNRIKRKDIWQIIFMQCQSFYNINKKPKLIILDSYSELTDQKFINIEKNEYFFANFKDVDQNSNENLFKSEGLINLKILEKFYRTLFEELTRKYGKTPIIFIHFNTALDPRKKFKERSEVIENIIEKIVKDCKFNLFTISIDEKDVMQADNDDFYYHYSEYTYKQYIKKFIKTIKSFDEIGLNEFISSDYKN